MEYTFQTPAALLKVDVLEVRDLVM